MSAFLLVLLFCVVVAALPPSSLERTLSRPARPFLEATGLDQGWGLFAPDPRSRVIEMRVRLEYADGHVRTWRPPEGYRWRKLTEHVVLRTGVTSLRRDVALYAARSAEGHPARAVLIRRWADLLPGASAGHGQWRERRHAYPVDPDSA